MLVKGIKPLFNHIVTTMDRYEDDQHNGSLIDVKRQSGMIKDVQRVVAVGTTVTSLHVGDLVKINPTRYMRIGNSVKDLDKSKNDVKFEFPVVEMGDEKYLFLFDTDIDYIITEYEEEAKATPSTTDVRYN